MLYLGIDPGKLGGLVVIDEKNLILEMIKTPLNDEEEIDWPSLFDIIIQYKDASFFTENLHSIYGSSAASNFSFGGNVKALYAILDIAKVNYQKVNPIVWQKFCFAGVPEIKNKKGKRDTKAMALVKAKRLQPNCSFTATKRSKIAHDGLVDAYLIAYYGLQNSLRKEIIYKKST